MSLAAAGLRLRYGPREAVAGVDLTVEHGEIIALLGANGSGKSTLLRGLARQLRPSAGVVELDGKALAAWPTMQFARRVGLLSQAHEGAGDLTVAQLVAMGRHPHQGFLSMPSTADRVAIERALDETGLLPFATRRVGELSGGERQQVWFALALAQSPDYLLLDEPTTYLDLANQLRTLELVARLNRERGLTVVMALHDLGQAARYAQRLVLLRGGRVIADGPPNEVLTPATVQAAFGVEVEILRSPGGVPVVAPLRAMPSPAPAAG